jgi:hypothetical protein
MIRPILIYLFLWSRLSVGRIHILLGEIPEIGEKVPEPHLSAKFHIEALPQILDFHSFSGRYTGDVAGEDRKEHDLLMQDFIMFKRDNRNHERPIVDPQVIENLMAR